MGKIMRALGLMSGTSLDGIDVAYLETDGENAVNRGPSMTFPYRDEVRDHLRHAIADARSLTLRHDRPGTLPHAERELTELHAAAVSAFLRKESIARSQIDVIGFHGQTVLHKPDAGMTVQLGLGEMLAELTRIPVIYDMRAADVAAGGQGAPLVPVYHRALASSLKDKPVAVVNIGGVANITFIGSGGRLIAFDTGPGNALIDDWMAMATGTACDQNGEFALKGRVDTDRLHLGLNRSFFSDPPPKSLDRNAFVFDLVHGLSLEDGAATLAALTAHGLARAREHLPEEPLLWIITGGGRKNRAIMAALAGLVEHAVVPAEVVGWDGDSLEAEAWGYLAVRSLCNLPITFPGTTGVAHPLTGGVLARPAKPARV